MYFADAYVAWQRGSNENSKSLLRKFFPKKTDLINLSINVHHMLATHIF